MFTILVILPYLGAAVGKSDGILEVCQEDFEEFLDFLIALGVVKYLSFSGLSGFFAVDEKDARIPRRLVIPEVSLQTWKEKGIRAIHYFKSLSPAVSTQGCITTVGQQFKKVNQKCGSAF